MQSWQIQTERCREIEQIRERGDTFGFHMKVKEISTINI